MNEEKIYKPNPDVANLRHENKSIDELIESLGHPVEENEYELKVIDGIWWINHKHIGSGEPLKQFLELFFNPPKQQV